jgi:SPP1 family predicted phage head-tail adaptor
MPQVPVQIGEYNRRVTIVNRSSARDAVGGQSNTWTDGLTVWAKITQLYSASNYQTAEIVGKATSSITIRWNPAISINIADRVRYTDPSTSVVTLYEIESVGQISMQNKEIYMLTYALNSAE